ncbi:signal peptidase I [Candidatus Beckwithbacteria bacterium RBG_13_35_6]|uniref:Signal peptidase I n=1 Tax=Candidatus Beckwithbacteria bacterium RBG_13_35_6 TaxID=1797456 RepID=A0A1F5DFX3_9BACT|nr:MAG: signal peptidase I [Candidatus Beckwithbacteria bacterium RBG_13_35_6]
MFKSILKAIFNFFLDFLQTIVTALSIFVIIYLFLVQPHQVKGNSMYTPLATSFNNGEYILTNKIGYRFEQPQRNEVIVFKAPLNEEYDYIKRIIAIPGDMVKINQGQIYLNSQLLDESSYLPANTYTQAGYFLKEGEELSIPTDKYFVLGDNRAHSSDSREWGLVSRNSIVGKAWFRYWPISKIGVIEYR